MGGGGGPALRRARAAILLECVVALAILVGVSMVLVGTATRAVDAMQRARQTEQAADLARTTLARIEIGDLPLERASGPVEAWRDEGDTAFDDDLPPDTGWRLETTSEPSPFEGLTLVTVRAVYQPGGEGGEVRAWFSLTQAVRLRGRGE